tara:strand:+ start:301 stop:846 length:546 start_codon:yes stop_codon:yes gene_type:complete
MANHRNKTLYVFDFDDTLVDTASSELRVKITHTLTNGQVKTYIKTSDEYASFKLPTTGKIQLNFADFETVPDDIEIKAQYFNLLQDALARGNHVIILTARAAGIPVQEFLKNNLKGRLPKIVAVGTSDPFAKSEYIKQLINKFSFNRVYYYDDAVKNIEAVETLQDEYPDVEFNLYHVIDE